MKNHFLKSSLLLSVLALLLFSACKKETTTPDDLNIVHVTLNKPITTVISGVSLDSIDFNRDGLCELVIELRNVSIDTGITSFATKSQYIEMAVEGLMPAPYVKLFNKGESQPISSSAYKFSGCFSIKNTGYRVGIIDNADKYLSFRFKTGTKFNYGWMKVNLNNTYTELKIIEYAYSILPDTPIAIGAE